MQLPIRYFNSEKERTIFEHISLLLIFYGACLQFLSSFSKNQGIHDKQCFFVEGKGWHGEGALHLSEEELHNLLLFDKKCFIYGIYLISLDFT